MCGRGWLWPVALAAAAMLSCDSGAGQGAPARPAASATVELRDPRAPEPLRPGRNEGYRHDYRFEEDWFTHNVPIWTALLAPYAGRPDLRYLEVGLWEGRSLLWMLDHVLTHPTSRATGIDIEILPTLLENLERSGASDRVTIIEGSSQSELRELPVETYDVVYIDGSHTADDVLEDMVLSWRLLRPDGLMILDDYRWKGWRDPSRAALPDELRPHLAIDAFVSAYRNSLDVVHKAYQMVLRKRPFTCPGRTSKCSRLGEYAYDWEQKVLFRDVGEVALSESERRLVEALIRGRRGDGLTIEVDAALAGSEGLATLADRLGLRLR